MQGAVDSFKEVFRKSFDWRFAWRFLALFIIEMAIVFGIGGIGGYGILTSVLASSFSASSLFAAAVGAFVLFLVVLALAAVVSAIGLALARDYLEGKKFTIASAYEKARPGMLSLIKIQVVVSVLFLALFLAILSPGIGRIISAFQDYGIEGAVSALPGFLTPLIAAIIAVVLVYVVLLPFLIVLSQSAFFGRLRVIPAMRRAWALGKRNFFYNWGFFLVFFVAIMVIAFVVGLIASSIETAGAGSVVALAIGEIINIALQIWLGIMGILFSVKIYLNNIGGAGAGRRAPRAKASKPRARRARKRKK